MRIASKQQITAREPNIGLSKKRNVDKAETETDHLVQKYCATTHRYHQMKHTTGHPSHNN